MLNLKDVLAGGFFVVVGLFFTLNAWLVLPLGTAFQMGPGYFPAVLGVVLTGLGLAIVAASRGAESEPFGPIPWRGLVLTSLAPFLFAVTVEGLGLVGALILSLLAAAPASRRVGPVLALSLSLGLTVFCILVFVVGLGLPMPLVGPWIGGK